MAQGPAGVPESVRGIQPADAARRIPVRDGPAVRGADIAPEAELLADEALHRVGLSLAEIQGRFPARIVGRAVAARRGRARADLEPQLIVADEPVSMIDASLRMSIVNLFRALRDELKVSIVYITHDLATAYYICDRIIIMRKGVVVERARRARCSTIPAILIRLR